jgi:hypothetical protein
VELAREQVMLLVDSGYFRVYKGRWDNQFIFKDKHGNRMVAYDPHAHATAPMPAAGQGSAQPGAAAAQPAGTQVTVNRDELLAVTSSLSMLSSLPQIMQSHASKAMRFAKQMGIDAGLKQEVESARVAAVSQLPPLAQSSAAAQRKSRQPRGTRGGSGEQQQAAEQEAHSGPEPPAGTPPTAAPTAGASSPAAPAAKAAPPPAQVAGAASSPPPPAPAPSQPPPLDAALVQQLAAELAAKEVAAATITAQAALQEQMAAALASLQAAQAEAMRAVRAECDRRVIEAVQQMQAMQAVPDMSPVMPSPPAGASHLHQLFDAQANTPGMGPAPAPAHTPQLNARAPAFTPPGSTATAFGTPATHTSGMSEATGAPATTPAGNGPSARPSARPRPAAQLYMPPCRQGQHMPLFPITARLGQGTAADQAHSWRSPGAAQTGEAPEAAAPPGGPAAPRIPSPGGLRPLGGPHMQLPAGRVPVAGLH